MQQFPKHHASQSLRLEDNSPTFLWGKVSLSSCAQQMICERSDLTHEKQICQTVISACITGAPSQWLKEMKFLFFSQPLKFVQNSPPMPSGRKIVTSTLRRNSDHIWKMAFLSGTEDLISSLFWKSFLSNRYPLSLMYLSWYINWKSCKETW